MKKWVKHTTIKRVWAEPKKDAGESVKITTLVLSTRHVIKCETDHTKILIVSNNDFDQKVPPTIKPHSTPGHAHIDAYIAWEPTQGTVQRLYTYIHH